MSYKEKSKSNTSLWSKGQGIWGHVLVLSTEFTQSVAQSFFIIDPMGEQAGYAQRWPKA